VRPPQGEAKASKTADEEELRVDAVQRDHLVKMHHLKDQESEIREATDERSATFVNETEPLCGLVEQLKQSIESAAQAEEGEKQLREEIEKVQKTVAELEEVSKEFLAPSLSDGPPDPLDPNQSLHPSPGPRLSEVQFQLEALGPHFFDVQPHTSTSKSEARGNSAAFMPPLQDLTLSEAQRRERERTFTTESLRSIHSSAMSEGLSRAEAQSNASLGSPIPPENSDAVGFEGGSSSSVAPPAPDSLTQPQAPKFASPNRSQETDVSDMAIKLSSSSLGTNLAVRNLGLAAVPQSAPFAQGRQLENSLKVETSDALNWADEEMQRLSEQLANASVKRHQIQSKLARLKHF